MKKYFFLASFVILAIALTAAGQTTAKPAAAPEAYDAELAKKAGADEYGMKQYVFVILRAGKTKRPGEKEMEPLQAGHLKNVMRLADEGKLALAGPFMDDGELRGLFIFNVKTVEEAKKLLESDPMISGGYLEAEFHPWYGSAAVTEINRLHKKMQKKKFVE